MTLIYYALTLALIVLHFAALSALASRCGVASMHAARAAGVLALVLVCFFLEHFKGWGPLFALWPLTTAAALWVLWSQRQTLKESGFWRSEAVFAVCLAYGLMWKWLYPSIYPTSERITDLYFITNYLDGATLPPPDHWFATRRFDFYYAFQHYGAGLMARLFALGPGLAYNLAMPLLMALSAALVWDIASRFVASRGLRVLLVATLMTGATGVSPVIALLRTDVVPDANERMVASARFIGLSDQRLNTPLAHALFPKQTRFEARELPLENLGYQYFVGDYHPPLGGFFLLLLALALMSAVQAGCANPRLHTALIGLTVPATIATNTWVFPLQALLVGGWALWRHRGGAASTTKAPGTDWAALIAGGAAGFLLLYPFLVGFANRSLATPLRWVSAMDHTPALQFLTLYWPLLLLMGLGIAASWSVSWSNWRQRNFTLYAALSFAALLLLSELVFVDDLAGGRYERTNTVMKWWGWIWTGGVALLGALLLGHPNRWIKGAVAAVLALITVSYSVDTVRYLSHAGPNDRGRLRADAVYTQETTTRELLALLARQPTGLVLENNYGDAYTDSTIFAAFSAKPTLMGWPMHLVTWHGHSDQIWATRDAIRSFYAGTHTDALAWLRRHQVRYVVWSAREAREQPQAWERLREALAPAYDWHPVSAPDQAPVGLWIRTDAR